MDVHPSDEPGAKLGVIRDQRSTLRQMTEEQLLRLGMHRVAYLKSGMCDGEKLFVLYGADGTPLLATSDACALVEMASEHGLGLVTVH